MGLGESAFKKAINTREHRERAQPASRAKLGLLEKKKDYIQRARDYHRKRDTIKALKIRASNRNPDEFNFGMIRSRVVDGRHIQNWTEKKKSLPADMLKLMKTQDVSYISMQIKSNQKKLEEDEKEMKIQKALREGPAVRSHLFFAEDDEEKEKLVGRARNMSRKERELARLIAIDANSEDEKSSAPSKEDMLTELDESPAERHSRRQTELIEARRERINQLEKLEYKLNLDRSLLAKGKRTKIGEDEYGFSKYKWAVERKK